MQEETNASKNKEQKTQKNRGKPEQKQRQNQSKAKNLRKLGSSQPLVPGPLPS
ncbi:hypothetical protein NC653_003904 [Populus alba x Populus x berolinensis]|uniref:Uncharacterized protein n=1 Tax=Populus alba x Populus x berolinensis TaxID=444605 RepID=A0AAD6RSU4_9ROSI|nr:hypothetical protein NC653_003904 [Populus alba x Populus x berolinensis]